MNKRIRKHIKRMVPLQKPKIQERLMPWSLDIPLNVTDRDRLSFSVLINKGRKVRKIANISYDILIEDDWISIVRFDDHDGTGPFHKHVRLSLKDNKVVESSEGVKRRGSKQKQFQWALNDIKKNYLTYRNNFMKNSGLDLY